ncbi:anticodon-binding domain-containing protein [Helicostylum pulchrum]|nr:anticodon-binding domain-containing protein [Helicostylum pulchrum]
MDEIGRQKTGSRQQSPSGDRKSLDSYVGKLIKVKTASNEELEGLIYTFDKITNCLVIDCSGSRKKSTFRIIKISHLKEIVSIGGECKKDYLKVGPVSVEQLKSREGDALKGFGNEVSKMGVGVTKEGQDIFNALSKTLPCRWSKDTIVVMDEVLITPPYSVDNCKANSSSGASLARVKKVLEGERKRLQK